MRTKSVPVLITSTIPMNNTCKNCGSPVDSESPYELCVSCDSHLFSENTPDSFFMDTPTLWSMEYKNEKAN